MVPSEPWTALAQMQADNWPAMNHSGGKPGDQLRDSQLPPPPPPEVLVIGPGLSSLRHTENMMGWGGRQAGLM